MKTMKYTYAVCPHCEHPNIHVHDGRICEHTTGMNVSCLGSRIMAKETHETPLNRNTNEFAEALTLAQSGLVVIPEQETTRPAFVTWKFSGLEFIAVPIDRGSFHIMDALGGNYGAWMTIEKFRKKQSDGILADWQSLGRAHLQVIANR